MHMLPLHSWLAQCIVAFIVMTSAHKWKWTGNVKKTFVSQLVPRLQRLFGDISDIDLFLGGLMERPVEDALLGPTFQCLVGDQFKRLKFGDRFWFEESGQPNSFSEGK